MTSNDTDTKNGGHTALTFGLGFAAGLALAAGAVLMASPAVRKALRDDLSERAKRIQDATAEGRRQASDVAGICVAHARDVAERARAAAAEGLRDTLAQWAAPADPRRSDLAGVDGIARVPDES